MKNTEFFERVLGLRELWSVKDIESQIQPVVRTAVAYPRATANLPLSALIACLRSSEHSSHTSPINLHRPSRPRPAYRSRILKRTSRLLF